MKKLTRGQQDALARKYPSRVLGVDTPTKKATERDIKLLWKYYNKGITNATILARLTGLTKTSVGGISAGNQWPKLCERVW